MVSQKIPVILASQSPRRIELLKTIIENFLIIPSNTDEVCDINLSPEENAIMLGRNKATCVAKHHPNSLVIGADTMVVFKKKILGKPTDIENARQILRQLSGQEHEVITGITLVHSQILSAYQISRVRMKNLNSKDINSYVESGEPMDKAGAYAIQGEGSFLVESYSGSYTNIIGLPMELLANLLQKLNFSI
ncbi:MAG TPA: septum formation protein Maf [Nitrospinaceae bacterium]|nr:septum formation protein Maf [Nitrospinaceae bacterium]